MQHLPKRHSVGVAGALTLSLCACGVSAKEAASARAKTDAAVNEAQTCVASVPDSAASIRDIAVDYAQAAAAGLAEADGRLREREHDQAVRLLEGAQLDAALACVHAERATVQAKLARYP